MMSSRRRAVLLLLQWKYALPGFLQLPTGSRRCRMIAVIGIVVSFEWPYMRVRVMFELVMSFVQNITIDLSI